MSQLTVTTGDEEHVFELPTKPGWHPYWSPSETGLDVRAFGRQLDETSWDFRIRPENTSVVIGDPSKTKPRIQAQITLEVLGGFAHTERDFPEEFPMGRGAWRQVLIGTERAPVTFTPDWRSRSSKYGPCEMPMPTFGPQQRSAMLSRDGASLRAIHNALLAEQPWHYEDSQDGVFSYPLGFAPHGPPDVGQVAGSGIYFNTGYRQSKPDLQRAFLIAQCEGDRARFWVDRTTGEPVSTEHYPATPTPDCWGFPAIPEVLPLLNSIDGGGDPLPLPYDHAHLIRGVRRTMQVAEQAGDPMCRWMVHAMANEQRLRFSQRGRLGVPGYSPGNLAALSAYAEPPNTGVFGSEAGRQIGWPFFLVAYDAKLNGWTGEMGDFADAALAFLDKAVTPAGPIQKVLEGSGWPSNGAFKTQTFENVILAYGATGLATQRGRTRPIYVDRVLESLYGPNTLLPILGGTAFRGPDHYPRSAQDDGSPVTRLQDGTAGYGDSTHAEAACALAAHLDPNPETWMQRWNLYGTTGFSTWQEKLAWATSLQAPDNLAWIAPGVAMAQKLQAQGTDG